MTSYVGYVSTSIDQLCVMIHGFGPSVVHVHSWPSTGHAGPFEGTRLMTQARSLQLVLSVSGNEGCQTNQEFGCQQLFARAIGLHSCRPGASAMSNGSTPELDLFVSHHHQNWSQLGRAGVIFMMLASVSSSWSGEPRMPQNLS